MISVAIADDQPLIRSAIRELLVHEADIQFVGEAANGLEAVDLAAAVMPDVLLMDIRMPQLDGIAATQRICARPELATVRVLVLTTFEEDDNIVQALRAGASGFIGKGADAAELIRAIRTIDAGETLLSSSATRRLIDRYIHQPPTQPHRSATLDVLTAREIEILALVGQGLSNTDIADALVISPATTKTHINRTMSKLDAHDRAQLVIIAYETGLVSPTRSD
ncbi:response regulator transcription factor [Microbacterium sp. HJ5]